MSSKHDEELTSSIQSTGYMMIMMIVIFSIIITMAMPKDIIYDFSANNTLRECISSSRIEIVVLQYYNKANFLDISYGVYGDSSFSVGSINKTLYTDNSRRHYYIV